MIGENFSAIGQSGDGNVPIQATALSSILAAGLKASDGPVDINAYESQKAAFETAFGIEDMNINPYNTTVDQADATANSSAILQIESLLSGMSAVLSGNSNKSPEEIQLEMQKAISETISASINTSGTDNSGAAPIIDFTDTSFISNVIETTANEVVEEGVDIEALKDNSTGLAACVGIIKTVLENNEGGDVSTQLLEMHKTAKAVKETVSAGADLTVDVTTLSLIHISEPTRPY